MRIYSRYTAEELESLGLSGGLPGHVGLIMDGNGRWAKQRLLPRSAGHRAGMEALKGIVRASHSIGIDALTVYAFSTENWGRPAAEIDALMSLLVEYFYKEIDELDANNVRIRTLGDITCFLPKLRTLMEAAVRRTESNTGLNFSVAINYGSRAEIVRAVRSIIKEGISEEDVTEECIAARLYTGELPELDLIIRTAGEQRLSNFLLYQAAYAEFVFTDTLFPAFTPEVYFDCLRQFMHRTRRFGKVKE